MWAVRGKMSKSTNALFPHFFFSVEPVHELNGLVNEWNNMAAQITGFTRDEVMGHVSVRLWAAYGGDGGAQSCASTAASTQACDAFDGARLLMDFVQELVSNVGHMAPVMRKCKTCGEYKPFQDYDGSQWQKVHKKRLWLTRSLPLSRSLSLSLSLSPTARSFARSLSLSLSLALSLFRSLHACIIPKGGGGKSFCLELVVLLQPPMARSIKDAQRLEIFDVPFPIIELAPWHDIAPMGQKALNRLANTQTHTHTHTHTQTSSCIHTCTLVPLF
jgi:hypothetical protein